MTHYICKYTPVELLRALGGECVVLDQMPDSFPLSDQLGHPNLCGFGKAVLEACLSGSVYDILLQHGKLDFLYLMDLLHCGGDCAKTRMKGELLALAEAYGAYKGAKFDEKAFRAAFQPLDRPTEPYLSVLGGRVGDRLFEAMEEALRGL